MADTEGMKLDIVILESRLPPAILQNESDIDLLRIGQKDMETVVRQQQETISKLNEESQFLRSKFKLIESLLSKLTDNNHESDVNDYSPAAYVCNISGVTSPHEGEQLVNPLNSNLHANSVTSNNNYLLPSIADEPVYFNLNDINPKTKTTEVSAFKQRPLRNMNQRNPIVNNIDLKRKPIVDSRNHHRSNNKYCKQSSELVELDKTSQESNDMNNNSHSTTGLNTKDGSSFDNDLPPSIADEPVHFNLNYINPKIKTTEVSAFKQRPFRDMSQCNSTVNNIELKRKPIADSRNHHRSDNKHRNKSSELVELDKSSQEPNDMNNNCHSTTGLNVKDGNTSPVIEVTVPDQPDRPNTGKYSNSDHMPPKHKSTVPCPFLLHRGRCIKGIKCDFSHSNLERKSKEQQRFSKPKHLTPCPFLERKGNCLKGSKCDFFHKSNHFQQRHHLKQYENLPFLEPLQSIKLLLEHVELGLQRFNVAGTRFQQTPISTDLNQYPLMAMSPNRQQLRPHMSNPLMAMPPNRQQLRPLMSHPLALLHFA